MPYRMPATLPEALLVLNGEAPRIIAGCTDFFPSLVPGHRPETILDITGVAACRGITRSEDGWRIGAAATWTDVLRADLPPAFDAMKLAARQVGSIQIQNRGTVVGNICNASPAADGIPPLLALDAQVEVASVSGTRTVPLQMFIKGVRSTDLAAGEMVTAVLVPQISTVARSAFLKLGSRTHLVISIVMVAAVVEVDQGVITDARVAVGSCSPVAQRLPALEARLIGVRVADVDAMKFTAGDALAPLSPISDVRGPADYRLDVAAELCNRAVIQASQGA